MRRPGYLRRTIHVSTARPTPTIAPRLTVGPQVTRDASDGNRIQPPQQDKGCSVTHSSSSGLSGVPCNDGAVVNDAKNLTGKNS